MGDHCASQIGDCLADATCAAGQACALACGCGDNACIVSCASKDPSPKALPVLACAQSSGCLGYGQAADLDCSKAACQKNCECLKDHCASQIGDCLADATCAAGQACALAC